MADKAVLDNLMELATRFRRAIDRSDRDQLGIAFKDFPAGSCGDTVIMLKSYLSTCGIKPLVRVCGQRREKSHAWLESDGLIIDITADQFEDCGDSVIVTRESDWHDTFKHDFESEENIRRYDPDTDNRLSRAYEEVLKHIQL